MPIEPWGAYTPELNVGRLTLGTGPASWIAMSLSWKAAAALLAEQIAGLHAITADLLMNWQGTSGPKIVASFEPYKIWLAEMETLALANSAAADAVVAAYVSSIAGMVPLPVVIANRVAARAAEATSQAATAAAFIPGAAPAAAGIAAQAAATSAELEAQYAGMWGVNASSMTAYDAAVTSATMPKIPPPPPKIVLGEVSGHARTLGDAVRSFGGSEDIVRHITSQGQVAGQQLSQFAASPPGQLPPRSALPLARELTAEQSTIPQGHTLTDAEFRSMLGGLQHGRGGIRSLGSLATGGHGQSTFHGGTRGGGATRGVSEATLGLLGGTGAMAASSIFSGVPQAPATPGTSMTGGAMAPPHAAGLRGGGASGSDKRRRVEDEDAFEALVGAVRSMNPAVGATAGTENGAEMPSTVGEVLPLRSTR